MRGWEDLLQPAAMDGPWRSFAAFIAALSPDLQQYWLGQAVLLTVEMLCDYCRRFLYPMRAYPCILMWLVHKGPTVQCPNRQACASDLLSAGEHDLDQTSSKIRAIFHRELMEAQGNGCLHPNLWRLLRQVATHWTLDTAEIEGVNSIIKTVSSRAPYIGWTLMSARIANKKNTTALLSQDFAAAGPDAVKAFLQTCTNHHDQARALLANTSRFDMVDVDSYPLRAEVSGKPTASYRAYNYPGHSRHGFETRLGITLPRIATPCPAHAPTVKN